jgi:hypothetical protein
MAEVRREDKRLKKDQSGSRETRDEVNEEIRPSPTKPHMEHPNRDHARGDWDRTNLRRDQGASRSDEEEE